MHVLSINVWSQTNGNLDIGLDSRGRWARGDGKVAGVDRGRMTPNESGSKKGSGRGEARSKLGIVITCCRGEAEIHFRSAATLSTNHRLSRWFVYFHPQQQHDFPLPK